MCGAGLGSRFGFRLGVLFSDRPESGGSCPVWGWGPTPLPSSAEGSSSWVGGPYPGHFPRGSALWESPLSLTVAESLPEGRAGYGGGGTDTPHPPGTQSRRDWTSAAMTAVEHAPRHLQDTGEEAGSEHGLPCDRSSANKCDSSLSLSFSLPKTRLDHTVPKGEKADGAFRRPTGWGSPGPQPHWAG